MITSIDQSISTKINQQLQYRSLINYVLSTIKDDDKPEMDGFSNYSPENHSVCIVEGQNEGMSLERRVWTVDRSSFYAKPMMQTNHCFPFNACSVRWLGKLLETNIGPSWIFRVGLDDQFAIGIPFW